LDGVTYYEVKLVREEGKATRHGVPGAPGAVPWLVLRPGRLFGHAIVVESTGKLRKTVYVERYSYGRLFDHALLFDFFLILLENVPFSPTLYSFHPLPLTAIGRKMSVPSAKLSTRASNAGKHPGIPDQTKPKRSPAEMAASRASEKAARDAKAAAAQAASVIVAAVEDSMVIDDMDSEKIAAQPPPANITRANRHPIRRTHTYADLRDYGFEDPEVQEREGQSPPVVFLVCS
jgi:hypothetical protein